MGVRPPDASKGRAAITAMARAGEAVASLHALFEVDRLSVRYSTPHGGDRLAVREFNLALMPAEVVAVIGESGSGKSQAFLGALHLLDDTAVVGGEARFASRNLLSMSEPELNRLRGAQIAMVFQDSMSALNPYLTIGRQLAETLIAHRSISKRDAWSASEEMLARVHIADTRRRMKQHPHELSGGMRQRVMIAMALLCNPSVLIADEPTTALDPTVQLQIIALLQELQASMRMAVVFISHDLALASGFARRILVMYAGRVVESASSDQLFRAPRHPYTAALLACLPDAEGLAVDRLAFLPERSAAADSAETGCSFAPRCPRARERCSQDRPLLEAKAPQHLAACHFPL